MLSKFISFLILFKSFLNIDIYNIDIEKILEKINIINEILEKKNIALFNECRDQVLDIVFLNTDYFNKNRKFVISLGKGLDDIGNELECYRSNLDCGYIFIKYYFKDDTEFPLINLTNYLDRNYSYLGLCLPSKCTELINEVKKISFGNETIDKIKENIKPFLLNDIKENNLFFYINIIIAFIFLLKIITSIFSKIRFPKGYSYHGYHLYLKMPDKLDNTIEDEEKEKEKLYSQGITNKDLFKYDDNNIKGDYNPIYDFEPFYPMYFRLVKYLDIFNNIMIFTKKRDRYYNENNINILCSIKTLILYYHIYNMALKILIILPNTSVLNAKFFGSFGLSLYKRTINSLVFWVILESATFSFKLMKFIKKKINSKGESSQRKRINIIFIIKQCLKFLCFYIPKIISFIIIFIFFYYCFGNYACNLSSKIIYHYIYEDHIKRRSCNNKENLFKNLLNAFIPFMNYKLKKNASLEYLNACYPFTYLYTNMFFSSLFFMILFIFIYYLENKIIDIIIFFLLLLNLIINYIYYFINDNKFYRLSVYSNTQCTEGKEIYNFFYHYSGEVYSIFYPHIFFSLYYFGCLLGFCFYYYSEYTNKQNYKNRKSKSINMNYAIIKEDKGLVNKSNSLDSSFSDENIEDNSFYCPFEFCSSFIIKLKNTQIWIKILLIIIYFIISIFLSIIPHFLFKNYNKGKNEENFFDFDISSKYHPLKLLYFFEKNINIFLFIFFICILLVLPKNYIIIKMMKSKIFLIISRSGFFATCMFHSLIYILFSLLQLEIQIRFLMIFYVVFGFFIIIIFIAIIATIIIEMPFRIMFKNLLKGDEIDKSRIILIKMRDTLNNK